MIFSLRKQLISANKPCLAILFCGESLSKGKNQENLGILREEGENSQDCPSRIPIFPLILKTKPNRQKIQEAEDQPEDQASDPGAPGVKEEVNRPHLMLIFLMLSKIW